MRSVAVAVTSGSGSVNGRGGGRGSRRAAQWAVDNLTPQADRFILVHVMPRITSIPTPSGEQIPIEELNAHVVAAYVQDVKEKFEQNFLPFKKLCKTSMMETLLLEDDDPAAGLLRYISESGIQILVMGTCSSNFITKKLKGPGVPTTILRSAPASCDVYLVARDRIISKLANSPPSSGMMETGSCYSMSIQRDKNDGNTSIGRELSGLSVSSTGPRILNNFKYSSISKYSYKDFQSASHMHSFANATVNQEGNSESSGDDVETNNIGSFDSMASASYEQSSLQEEVKRLQQELQSTIAMYEQVCEELVHAQNKTLLLSSEYVEETRRVNAALEREETLRKIAAEEKAKHLEIQKELQEAKNMLAKESYERQMAELNVMKESIEKQRILDTLLSKDKRYRNYTMAEIEEATNFFSEDFVIGEGGYGKVYKCSLDHTLVAIKVLEQGAMNKREEFLKEVEVLSQLHHPNIMLLLGACPESGCLVYECLENGSLEDYLPNKYGKPPLPWFIRFRILFEMACGLSFLHNSKPDPIVHRDLKPGNILLDKNYVSKIGDVGLAELLFDVVPDNVTEYRESMLAGTLHYMDPEYQRTGTVRPKSDVYALGVIILQIMTARHARGLILTVENAVRNKSFPEILDRSAGDWPLTETVELAHIGLKCSALRCRDRPDLDTEVLPLLKRLSDFANATAKLGSSIGPPSQYYCPILQEIMDDPHIAADGFTYEHRAIKAWLSKHNVSPVTKLRLQHSVLIPNHTLRSAIQEWKSGMKL